MMMVLGGIVFCISFGAVYRLGLKPCLMCKVQRIPFALLMINSFLGMVTHCKAGFFKVVQGALLLGGILGLVHFLLQLGALPDFCVRERGMASAQAFSERLIAPRCSDRSFEFAGMPVSLISAGLCVGVFGLSIRGKGKMKRKRAERG